MNHVLPGISVVIPSFNQAAFLGQAIRSATRQGYPHLECLVVDGGSTDGSVDVIRAHDSELSWWVSEPDRGQSHAVNKGLARARGEIIGWLNSDDLYLDGCLAAAAEYLTGHPDVDVLFADYAFIDEAGRFVKMRREIPFSFETYRWTADCYHANCAAFFRRRVFGRVGGLDEARHYSMDYEFYLRAAAAGARFGYVRQPWGAYRLHAGSKSTNGYRHMVEEARAVAPSYWPSGVSSAAAAGRRRMWQAIRLARKTLRGSYLPPSREARALVEASVARAGHM